MKLAPFLAWLLLVAACEQAVDLDDSDASTGPAFDSSRISPYSPPLVGPVHHVSSPELGGETAVQLAWGTGGWRRFELFGGMLMGRRGSRTSLDCARTTVIAEGLTDEVVVSAAGDWIAWRDTDGHAGALRFSSGLDEVRSADAVGFDPRISAAGRLASLATPTGDGLFLDDLTLDRRIVPGSVDVAVAPGLSGHLVAFRERRGEWIDLVGAWWPDDGPVTTTTLATDVGMGSRIAVAGGVFGDGAVAVWAWDRNGAEVTEDGRPTQSVHMLVVPDPVAGGRLRTPEGPPLTIMRVEPAPGARVLAGSTNWGVVVVAERTRSDAYGFESAVMAVSRDGDWRFVTPLAWHEGRSCEARALATGESTSVLCVREGSRPFVIPDVFVDSAVPVEPCRVEDVHAACSDSRCVVTWWRNGQWALEFSKDATPEAGTTRLVEAEAEGLPLWDGNRFVLLTGTTVRALSPPDRVLSSMAQRVSAGAGATERDGAVLVATAAGATGLDILLGTSDEGLQLADSLCEDAMCPDAAVAGIESGYLLIWRECRGTPRCYDSRLLGARLDISGTAAEVFEIAEAPVFGPLSAARTSTGVAMSWAETRTGERVGFAFADPDGEVRLLGARDGRSSSRDEVYWGGALAPWGDGFYVTWGTWGTRLGASGFDEEWGPLDVGPTWAVAPLHGGRVSLLALADDGWSWRIAEYPEGPR